MVAKMYKTARKLSSGVGIVMKCIVTGIFIFPFLWMVSVSLQTADELSTTPLTLIPASPQWINFLHAWQSGPFLTYLRNSLVIIASIVVIQLIIMVPAAYAFAKYNFPGKSVLFGLVLVAFMTPTQITFLPIYNLMSSWGVMKTLIPQIIPHMTNAFGIFLLRQYFMQIPDEIIEAARLDNAGVLKIVYKIMLPMSKSAMATIVLFSFVSNWNEYFWPLIMTTESAIRPLTMGVAMLKSTEGVIDWNTIMAGNMILVLPILVVYVFCSKYIIKAFAYSGIK